MEKGLLLSLKIKMEKGLKGNAYERIMQILHRSNSYAETLKKALGTKIILLWHLFVLRNIVPHPASLGRSLHFLVQIWIVYSEVMNQRSTLLE